VEEEEEEEEEEEDEEEEEEEEEEEAEGGESCGRCVEACREVAQISFCCWISLSMWCGRGP
jgi:hypothetical protein